MVSPSGDHEMPTLTTPRTCRACHSALVKPLKQGWHMCLGCVNFTVNSEFPLSLASSPRPTNMLKSLRPEANHKPTCRNHRSPSLRCQIRSTLQLHHLPISACYQSVPSLPASELQLVPPENFLSHLHRRPHPLSLSSDPQDGTFPGGPFLLADCWFSTCLLRDYLSFLRSLKWCFSLRAMLHLPLSLPPTRGHLATPGDIFFIVTTRGTVENCI